MGVNLLTWNVLKLRLEAYQVNASLIGRVTSQSKKNKSYKAYKEVVEILKELDFLW